MSEESMGRIELFFGSNPLGLFSRAMRIQRAFRGRPDPTDGSPDSRSDRDEATAPSQILAPWIDRCLLTVTRGEPDHG